MKRDGKRGVHLDGSTDVGVSRLEVIEGPSGRRQRTKAEQARIAAESMLPRVRVADVARKHGTTRWHFYDWRKQIRAGNLVLPESVAVLPMFAELVVDDSAVDAAMPCRQTSPIRVTPMRLRHWPRISPQNFAPSCFHSASTVCANANAAPEGGAQVSDNA
ncbi:MAG: transposase [Kiritimatiellia bacterium]